MWVGAKKKKKEIVSAAREEDIFVALFGANPMLELFGKKKEQTKTAKKCDYLILNFPPNFTGNV